MRNKKTVIQVINELSLHYHLSRTQEKRLHIAYKQFYTFTGKATVQDITTNDLIHAYREWRKGCNSYENMRKRMGYIKRILSYAHSLGYIKTNPAQLFKMPKMAHKPIVTLTQQQLTRLQQTNMPEAVLTCVKDMFLFQCYTGLSYCDLMAFTESNVRTINGKLVLTGKRKKTGQEYIIPMLPEAKVILKRYNHVLPRYSNVHYNRMLKKVTRYAQLGIELTTHIGRKTFGQMMIDRGVSVDSVARMLGHTTTFMTERHYARVGMVRVLQDVAHIAAA